MGANISREQIKEKGGFHSAAASFGPVKVDGLIAGETRLWCRCGLSKSQPWCDDSHEGTGITPLEWKVEKSGEALLCQCKQTKTPPLCDDSHIKAMEILGEMKKTCRKKGNHTADCRLCTDCGWVPDF